MALDVIDLTHTIATYLVMGLVFLLIYKIYKLASAGIGALGGKDGSKSGKKEKGDDESDSGKDSKDKRKSQREKFQEAEENPGKFSVWVRNLDDKGVKGAWVEVFPSRTKIWRKKSGKYGRDYKGHTNQDGIWPSSGEGQIGPSVTYKVRVTYKLEEKERYKISENVHIPAGKFKMPRNKSDLYKMLRLESPKGHQAASNLKNWIKVKPWGKGRLVATTEIEVTPNTGEPQVFTVTLPYESEYAYGFEPHIEKVDYESTPDKIYTEGIIRP